MKLWNMNKVERTDFISKIKDPDSLLLEKEEKELEAIFAYKLSQHLNLSLNEIELDESPDVIFKCSSSEDIGVEIAYVANPDRNHNIFVYLNKDRELISEIENLFSNHIHPSFRLDKFELFLNSETNKRLASLEKKRGVKGQERKAQRQEKMALFENIKKDILLIIKEGCRDAWEHVSTRSFFHVKINKIKSEFIDNMSILFFEENKEVHESGRNPQPFFCNFESAGWGSPGIDAKLVQNELDIKEKKIPNYRDKTKKLFGLLIYGSMGTQRSLNPLDYVEKYTWRTSFDRLFIADPWGTIRFKEASIFSPHFSSPTA